MSHRWMLTGKFSFNAYLLALTMATLVPVFVISGVAVWRAAISYQETATVRLLDTALTLASAIESDIESRYTFLSVLAANDPNLSRNGPTALATGRFDHVSFEGDVSYIRLERSETPTVPDSIDAMAQAAIEKDSPSISNLKLGDTLTDHRLSIALPISRDSGEREAIVLSMRPDQIIRSLQQSNRALSGMLVAVTDGNGRILARSRDAGRSVGRRAPDWDKLVAADSNSGWFEAVTTDNRTIILAFQTVPNTPGWRIVVGEPLDVFNARWREPLITLGIGALLALLFATLLSLFIGRRILNPVVALANRGEALAAGETPQTWDLIPHSPIREFESLRRTAVAAERAQHENDRRLSVLAHAGAMVIWRWRSDQGIVWIKGWGQLTGTPDAQAHGIAWMNDVHPDDHARLFKTFRSLDTSQSVLMLEMRVRTVARDWSWVRLRGAPISGVTGGPTHWGGVLEDINERKQHEARIAYLAHHDTLTGLGNRALLSERLAQATANKIVVVNALLCIDLDHFKEVNDTYGHPTGDRLLCAVASRLKSSVRECDFIARVGGDEFNIIQYGASQPEDSAELAHRIITVLSQPFEIDGTLIRIGASVGVSLLNDETANDDEYLKRADNALYRSKREGRGRAYFANQEALSDRLIELLRAADGPPAYDRIYSKRL